MGIDQALIDTIVQRVLQVTQPDRIILFGSAATGQMTRDSDIDLLILTTDTVDPYLESFKIRKNLRGLGFPFDVIIMKTEWFDANKTIIGGLPHPANKYGKVIYAAA